MIQVVRFQGFKALHDVTIELKPFTLFIGPNGSGKSSVLQAMELLCRLARTARPQDIFTGPLAIERIATRPAGREVRLFLATDAALRFQTTMRPKGLESKLDLVRPGRVSWEAVDATNLGALEDVASCARLRVDADRIKEPAVRGAAGATLEYDGSRLAPTLADLIGGREDDAVQAIERDLARIMPTCKRVRVVPADIERVTRDAVRPGEQTNATERRETVPGYSIQVDVEGTGWVDADLLSEGTLMVLALLTVMHGPARPRLLLLDDLDRGLHPTAQAELIERLRDLQKREPTLQIIASTHSPYLVDKLEPMEIRVMGCKAGKSVCKKMTDHPDWQRWKDSLRARELWGSAGDDWITS